MTMRPNDDLAGELARVDRRRSQMIAQDASYEVEMQHSVSGARRWIRMTRASTANEARKLAEAGYPGWRAIADRTALDVALGANSEAHPAKHEAERGAIANRTGVAGGPPTKEPSGTSGLKGSHYEVPEGMTWPSRDAAPGPGGGFSDSFLRGMSNAALADLVNSYTSTTNVPRNVMAEWKSRNARDAAMDIKLPEEPPLKVWSVTIKWAGGEREVRQAASSSSEAVRIVRAGLTGQEARWASVFA